MTRTLSLTSALPAVVCLALVGCEASKSSNPLSPSVAGPIAGVQITAPKMLEPTQGFKFKETEQPIKLLIENSSTTGVRPVTYTFEVASDDAFNSKVYARSGVAAGDGGRTSVIVEKLDLGRGYYWRVRADDGANSSLFASSNFEVLPKALLNAPVLISPIDNVRTTTRRPELTVGSSERNAAVGRVTYEFQIATDPAFASSSLVAAGGRDDAGGTTSYMPDGDLTLNIQHFWRARATDGETTSAWSSGQVFRTPAPVVVPPGPGPGPGNPGSCASSNGDTIAQCTMAKYPQYLAAGVSQNQRVSNMEFLRNRMIEAGICGGLDLAYNKKRGTGPHSIDALAWRVNGRDEVVDIGAAHDDTSTPLRLQWGIVAGPAGYDPYPRPNCR